MEGGRLKLMKRGYSVFREKGEVVMRGGEGEEERVIKKRGEGEC